MVGQLAIQPFVQRHRKIGLLRGTEIFSALKAGLPVGNDFLYHFAGHLAAERRILLPDVVVELIVYIVTGHRVFTEPSCFQQGRYISVAVRLNLETVQHGLFGLLARKF